ncbi:hypothetical protein GCM10022233_00910 [Streptomyces shaanxiensis]|uniref:Uncharacterized protein n=1 Tax=Streptomyces shaanxiensis TaxID=653357 RepID=A0ABP7U6B6_9ACTN
MGSCRGLLCSLGADWIRRYWSLTHGKRLVAEGRPLPRFLEAAEAVAGTRRAWEGQPTDRPGTWSGPTAS